MRRYQIQSLCWTLLLCSFRLILAADKPGQAPATADGVCGDENYRVTLCFPGTPQNATCSFSIQNGTSLEDSLSQAQQRPCPQSLLFQQPCRRLLGALTIAFGRCNVDDGPTEQRADNTLDVAAWGDVLGLRRMEELGTLLIRGYAYQESYSVLGINLLPNLKSLRESPILPGDTPQNLQISMSGLAVPPLPQLQKIPAGLSILNSPDMDFTNPPRFPLLTEVQNGISIAGCNSLRSLQGLEKLRTGPVVSNVQIINNLILSNMSALTGMFKCQPDGGTQLDPSLVVGTIAAHPLPLQPINHGCTLNTPGTICEYIADSSQCPNGTEYVRNNDGTIQRVYRMASSPAPSLAPMGAGLAPLSATASQALPSIDLTLPGQIG